MELCLCNGAYNFSFLVLAGWLALFLIDAGDVGINPDTTTRNNMQTSLDLRYLPQTNTQYDVDIDKVKQDYTLSVPNMRRYHPSTI